MEYSLNFADLVGQLSCDDSVFPRVIVNDGSLTTHADAVKWVAHNKARLDKVLAHSGAILFRGFPIKSIDSFDAFSAAFDYKNFTYQESLSNAVRINFTERVFTANEAPKDVEIYLHHEMAQTPVSPSKLFFYCKQAADEGGATPLCRSDMLFNSLEECVPELAAKFEKEGLKYTTYMPAANDLDSGQGRSWRSTLSVKSQTEAEKKLADLGYSWEWLEDGSLKATTPVLPAVIKVESGRRVFYNQLIAAFMGWKGVKTDPSSALTFGDGSPIPVEGLQLIVDLSTEYTFDLLWQDDDVALVDNRMAMHGRRPYSGERKREVLVALALD